MQDLTIRGKKRSFYYLLLRIPLLIAVLIQTFSFYLPFYDGLAENGFSQAITSRIYILRDICLFLNFLILLLNRKFKKDVLLLIALSVWVILLTAVINPGNIDCFNDNGVRTLFIMGLQVYAVVRSGYIELKHFKICLKWFSRVLCLVSIDVFMNLQFSLFFQQNYMDFANAMCVLCGLLAYFAIIEKSKIDALFMIVAYILLFIAGGRGSFSTMSLLLFCLFWLGQNDKTRVGKYILVAMLILEAFSFATDYIISISSTLGFESRNIDRLIGGGFFYSEDRMKLWRHLFDKACEHPVFGSGICADRFYLIKDGYADNGFYAHNIFIELFVDFGFCGIVLFGYLIILIIKFYKNIKDKQYVCFVTVFIFTSFFQLMLSRSFLTEPNFYLLFALIVNALYDNRYRLIRNC